MAVEKSWYVRTGFGAMLGPMPDDALRELAQTGALVPSDEVRDGATGEWFTAAEIPHLFTSHQLAPSVAQSLHLIATTLERATTEREPLAERAADEPQNAFDPPLTPIEPREIEEQPPESATGDETEVLQEDPEAGSRRRASFEPESDATDPLSFPSPPPDDPLIAEWKSERARTIVDLGLVSLASEMTQTQDEQEFPLEIPGGLFDDEPKTPSHVAVPQTPPLHKRTFGRPAFLDQVTGLENGPRARPETWEQTLTRWRRSLPSWQVVTLALVIVVGLWWVWPRSQRGTYDRYVALWNEWKARRADFKDKEGWENFLKHVRAELDETVPWLEKNTKATDQSKLVLLFIGRDCLKPMLQHPRTIGSKEERHLETLLATAKAIYDPNAVQAREVSSKTNPTMPTREFPTETLEGAAPANATTDQPNTKPTKNALPKSTSGL
jgi:hypothetical protein